MSEDTIHINGQSDLQGLPSLYTKRMVDNIARNFNFDPEFIITVEPGSEKGENFFGEIYKVKITDKTNDKCMKLILKVAPDNPTFRQNLPLRQYYCREIDAYMLILPEFEKCQHKFNLNDKFEFAKCYAANNEDCKESIIVEDLTDQGFHLCDRLVTLDFDHAVLVIKCLAKLHATSFVVQNKDPTLFSKLTEHALQKSDYGVNFPKFLEQNKKQVLDVIDDCDEHKRLSIFLSDANEKLEKFLDPKYTEPYNTICHGDCWTSNLLFKYKEKKVVDVRMIDWQVTRLASPVTDIAYFILTSTDENFRSAYFHQLLDIYYATLSTSIAEMDSDVSICYPEHIYRAQINNIFAFGLIMSIAICPVILSDKNETPDLIDAANTYNNKTESKIKLSKTPTQRIKGAVKDCIKFNLI